MRQTAQLSFTVSLPPPELSPNARVFGAALRVKGGDYAEAVGWELLAAWPRHRWPAFGRVMITEVFVFDFARDRWHDLDNLMASAKYLLDGLVRVGLLAGDGPAHVALIAGSLRHEPGVRPHVAVTITEYPDGVDIPADLLRRGALHRMPRGRRTGQAVSG